jgi:hypothetical protein
MTRWHLAVLSTERTINRAFATIGRKGSRLSSPEIPQVQYLGAKNIAFVRVALRSKYHMLRICISKSFSPGGTDGISRVLERKACPLFK